MKKYKCIKKLAVDETDILYGNPTGNHFTVNKGELWFDENHESEGCFSGFLTNYDESWLQIDESTLIRHFQALEQENE